MNAQTPEKAVKRTPNNVQKFQKSNFPSFEIGCSDAELG